MLIHLRFRCLLTMILITVFARGYALNVTDLNTEYRINPMGVDSTNPGLSWRMSSDERGQNQTAYQILVAKTPDSLKKIARSSGIAEKLFPMKASPFRMPAWRWHHAKYVFGKCGYGTMRARLRNGVLLQSGRWVY